MKKYKLIKGYPGSPKIGTIVMWNRGRFYFDKSRGKAYLFEQVENYPEFWEEVKEVEEMRRLFANSMDKCPIYYGDKFYYIENYEICELIAPRDVFGRRLLFCKKDNAEKYIYDNKPIFSRNEILSILDKVYGERFNLDRRWRASQEFLLIKIINRIKRELNI